MAKGTLMEPGIGLEYRASEAVTISADASYRSIEGLIGDTYDYATGGNVSLNVLGPYINQGGASYEVWSAGLSLSVSF
jgi:hypothetical protein